VGATDAADRHLLVAVLNDVDLVGGEGVVVCVELGGLLQILCLLLLPLGTACVVGTLEGLLGIVGEFVQLGEPLEHRVALLQDEPIRSCRLNATVIVGLGLGVVVNGVEVVVVHVVGLDVVAQHNGDGVLGVLVLQDGVRVAVPRQAVVEGACLHPDRCLGVGVNLADIL